MSAPFGRRDIHGRVLLCEIAVGQTERTSNAAVGRSGSCQTRKSGSF